MVNSELLENVTIKLAANITNVSTSYLAEASTYLAKYIEAHKITEAWEEVALEFVELRKKHPSLTPVKIIKLIDHTKYLNTTNNTTPYNP